MTRINLGRFTPLGGEGDLPTEEDAVYEIAALAQSYSDRAKRWEAVADQLAAAFQAWVDADDGITPLREDREALAAYWAEKEKS